MGGGIYSGSGHVHKYGARTMEIRRLPDRGLEGLDKGIAEEGRRNMKS